VKPLVVNWIPRAGSPLSLPLRPILPDRRTDRIAFFTCHVDDHFQRPIVCDSGADLLPRKMVQMNLRSSKHLELTVIVHHSPGKIEEPFLGRSFCKWPQKVRRAIWLSGGPESRTKYRLRAITRHSFNDLVAFLNAKIHRLIIGKTDPWKVPTNHFDCQFIALRHFYVILKNQNEML
jgi:hypothetical protein